jgi:hypothetical protein
VSDEEIGEFKPEAALSGRDTPHPIWVPIRFGPFWYRSRQVDEYHIPEEPSSNEYLESLLVGPGVFEAEIDGYGGSFDLSYEGEAFPTAVYPYEIVEVDLPSTSNDASIKERIQRVWSIMQDEFLNAINREECVIYARAESPLNSFRLISPDILQYFEIKNWNNGLATSQSGHLLYSLHVAPAVPHADPIFDDDPLPQKPKIMVARRMPRAPKLENAKAAVEWIRQTRGTIDDLTDKELSNAVTDRMKSLGQSMPSMETIRRAAGRR